MGFARPWYNSYSPQPPVEPSPRSYFDNSSSYPIGNVQSYGSHGGSSHSGRSDGANRFAAPGGVNEPYRSYGAGYACGNTDNKHTNESYANMTTFPFNSRDVYLSQPRAPPQEHFGTGPPTFMSATAAPYGWWLP